MVRKIQRPGKRTQREANIIALGVGAEKNGMGELTILLQKKR